MSSKQPHPSTIIHASVSASTATSSHFRQSQQQQRQLIRLLPRNTLLQFLVLLACTHALASTSSQFSFLPKNNNAPANNSNRRWLVSQKDTASAAWGIHTLRGGAGAGEPAAASPTTSANSNTLQCVMQIPRPASKYIPSSSSSSSSSNRDENRINDHQQRKQQQQPLRVKSLSSIASKRRGSSSSSLTATAAARGGASRVLASSAAATTTTSSSSSSSAVEYVAETKLPTDLGQFQLRAYRVPGAPLGQEPCVIYSRDRPPFGQSSVPVRIHDQCLTSEVFRSQRCDCKEQLQMALHYIQKHGGCIIYLQQEGRGIGLANKVAAYALQDIGLDTVDANLHLGFPEDSREYGVVPGILADMKISSVELMTNNPRKVSRLEDLGVTVERTLPMVVAQANPYNHKYLETKRKRMNHKNLAELLSRDPTMPLPAVAMAAAASQAQTLTTNNGVMVPRRHIADQYINNGTEMSANAVQVSLLIEDDDDDDAAFPQDGVQAAEDGYCFGRQSVVNAIAAVARGEMVVVVDDMNRENEGDFIMAADRCTDLDMARIVRYSSGVICVAMDSDRLDELQLHPMVTDNQDPKGTAFTVSVDASREHGITTGISAGDRAKTVQLLANPQTTASDFSRPGHLFPLRARPGGVLERDGHTEASVDLARLAGRSPCGVLCEIVSEEVPTEMMRLPELKRFCKRHGFIMTSIADIAQYRRETGL